MKYIRKIRKIIVHLGFRTLTILYSLRYPLIKNKVLFLSDVREVMGGNLKCVYDYLENKDYERAIEFRADRRIRRSLKQYFQLACNVATSHYIILDDFTNIVTHMHVRKDHEIVQLWHGPGAFKKFGWSRATNGEPIGKIHKGYKKYTKAAVSGEGIRWCYAEAFSISKDKVKAVGFPRTDDFYNEEYKDTVVNNFYQEYPDLKNKKIILFAPTYRGTKVSEASYDFSQIDIDGLYERFHDEYVFMIKWHPALYNNIVMGNVEPPQFSKYPNFYLDFSKYRDINELLFVCDCLITDYSSVIFDYVLLNKPIVYYAYDLDEYEGEGGRGLYFPFQEYVYGSVAKNSHELIESLSHKDLMIDKRKQFFDKFMGECDGHSTEKVCQWIFNDNK